MQNKDTLKIYWQASFVIGIVCLLVSLVVFILTKQFISHAVQTTGIVVDLISETASSSDNISRTTLYPKISFLSQDGVQRTFTSNIGSSFFSYQKGTAIALLYQKDDPTQVRINDFFNLWLMPTAFLVIAIALFIIGVILETRKPIRLYR